MIAIDIEGLGEGLSARLQSSLGLPTEHFVVLSAEDTDCRGADVLVVSQVKRERLEKIISPSIKWIHVLSTGVDRFPFDLLGDCVLTCSRGASALAISEFVLAAMLALEKHLPEVWISGADEWRDIPLGQLAGKVLGLVGIGAIGTETAKRALAFDMHVIAYRRTRAPSPMAQVSVVGTLEEVLSVSDHLVIAAPATPGTFHMIDGAALAGVKRGVHLVNISRGKLVDQQALLEALDDDRVAMATLDVTEPEPLPAEHALYSHPRVRLSPHVSWSAAGTVMRSIELFEENVRRHQAGDGLQGLVDVAEGY